MKRDQRRLRAIQNSMGPTANAHSWLEMFRRGKRPRSGWWDFEGAYQAAPMVKLVLGANTLLPLWVANLDSLLRHLASDLQQRSLLCLYLSDLEAFTRATGSGGGAANETRRRASRQAQLEAGLAGSSGASRVTGPRSGR